MFEIQTETPRRHAGIPPTSFTTNRGRVSTRPPRVLSFARVVSRVSLSATSTGTVVKAEMAKRLWATLIQATVTLCEPVSESLKAAFETVDESNMKPSGKLRAREVVRLCERGATTGEMVACPTGDDGMTVEIVQGARDLLFAIPDDGSALYFTARADRGFRRSGMIVDDSAITRLVEWAAGGHATFPENGIRIG